MLHVVTTGAYHPRVVTTWKILTTGASYLTTGTWCIVPNISVTFYNPGGEQAFHRIYKLSSISPGTAEHGPEVKMYL